MTKLKVQPMLSKQRTVLSALDSISWEERYYSVTNKAVYTEYLAYGNL